MEKPVTRVINSSYFLDLEPKDVAAYISGQNMGAYRVKQVLKWVYQKRVSDFSACSDLSKSLRESLKRKFYLRSLKIAGKKTSSIDETVRFDFITQDGHRLPSVFLPRKDRNVVCISTQIGCTAGCRFCQSGANGFIRNLTRGEILEQIFQISNDLELKIDGVLLMGMGEPMLNYNSVVSAVRSIVDRELLGIGRRKITISTAGYVPQIKKLSKEKLGVRLAISLHAADDDIRKRLVSKKAPFHVNEILNAGIDYCAENNARLTIEYVLISGVNDTLQSAKKLVKLIRKHVKAGVSMQINLIPYNPTDADCRRWHRPTQMAIEEFRDYLVKNKVLAIVRQAKGADIGSACGQLGV